MNHFQLARQPMRMAGSLAVLALAAVLASSRPAHADTGFDVRIDIGNAPPAPHIFFRARPREVYVPEERVYVVDDPALGDNDCFRYQGSYWVFREGYWYRAPRWRGPFTVVQPRYVPTAFYHVPAERWKHHANWGPPGQMKKGDEWREHHGRGHNKHGDDDDDRDH